MSVQRHSCRFLSRLEQIFGERDEFIAVSERKHTLKVRTWSFKSLLTLGRETQLIISLYKLDFQYYSPACRHEGLTNGPYVSFATLLEIACQPKPFPLFFKTFAHKSFFETKP